MIAVTRSTEAISLRLMCSTLSRVKTV